jgi:hypothetical protein
LVSESNRPAAVSVGNYIRTDKALLMRHVRANRFSSKYREAIIRRLASGKASLGQIRQQLNVSEREIFEWVTELLRRQQDRIDQLTSPEYLQSESPEAGKLDRQTIDANAEGIENRGSTAGRVQSQRSRRA